MRWLTNFYDFSLKWTATAAIGIHPTKAWLSQLVNFKNAIWTWGHFRRMICNKILFKTWFKERRESVRDDERCGRSKEVNTPELIGQRLRVRVTMLRFLGSSGEIPLEEASTLQIGWVAFPPGQCTSPQLQTIWPRWPSRQPPCSLDLALCDFCWFPKLRGCRYETIEEMKEAVTKVIDTLTQEDFHGAYQNLLEQHNKCIAAGGDYFEGD